MIIDIYTHLAPRSFLDRMVVLAPKLGNIVNRLLAVKPLSDLDVRFRDMDTVPDYRQLISLPNPSLEEIGPADTGCELARIANDELAELCAKYPDRFPGYTASVSMNHPDAARELERAFDNGANGVQIYSNIAGRPLDEPEYFGVFEVCAKRNKPILIHPARAADMTDYKNEDKSKYEIWWTFGWPYETSAAMARIVFSGMLDKLPELKIVAHHLGAMVPYFEGRVGPGWDQLGKRTSDEDYSIVLKNLKKRPFDYFKDFYADTATFGSRPATECGLAFYGQDKVLFASDCPFDPEKGPGYIRETIAVLESIDMPQEMREKIAYKNAQELFGLKK